MRHFKIIKLSDGFTWKPVATLKTSKRIYNLIYAQLKAHNKEGVRCSDGRVVVRSVGRIIGRSDGRWSDGQMIGWSDGRMVSGRLVGRPDSRTVGWSVGGRSGGQLGRWSDGPGWWSGWMVTRSGGQKGPRVIRRSSLAFVWKANVFGASPSTERITFTWKQRLNWMCYLQSPC